MNDNERSVFAISDMAYSSLWFLGVCMHEPDKTVKQVYDETIGKSDTFSAPVMNAGTAILGAYALFVLPRGTLFDEFSKALTGQGKLEWTGFVWNEPDKYGPKPEETNWNTDRSDHMVLGGIRNGLAHGNFEIEIQADAKATIIHIWSQQGPAATQKRNVRVSVTDLAAFVMRFHQLFTLWHHNNKTFPDGTPAPAAPTGPAAPAAADPSQLPPANGGGADPGGLA